MLLRNLYLFRQLLDLFCLLLVHALEHFLFHHVGLEDHIFPQFEKTALLECACPQIYSIDKLLNCQSFIEVLIEL